MSAVLAPKSECLVPLTAHWVEAACASLARHRAVARVMVAALRGSAPREAGACMLVDLHTTRGTIGGGRLEWQATRAARELLRDPGAAPVRTLDLILGPALRQCCGGRVELWLERLTRDDLPWLRDAAARLRARESIALATEMSGGAHVGGGAHTGGGDVRGGTGASSAIVRHRVLSSTPATRGVHLRRTSAGRITLLEDLYSPRPPLWIYGAGHVGQALVRVLAEVALFDITWIDSRAELLPAGMADGVGADLARAATARVCAAPADSVADAAAGTRFVVLTHDHALDYELCRRILERGDSAGLGLIGSASKAARFRSRLRRDGISREALAGLNCPIGVEGISSKLPAAIAIAIAAQLLQQLDAPRATVALPAPVATVARHNSPAAQGGCAGNCESCGAEQRQDA
jgi:xanthine dehydrogenase accessory factor